MTTVSCRSSTNGIVVATLIIVNILFLTGIHKGTSESIAKETLDTWSLDHHFQSNNQNHHAAFDVDSSEAFNLTFSPAPSKDHMEKNRVLNVSSKAFTTLHSCQLHNQTVTIPTAPYLIIIGVQKAGTTSMTQWLNEHPQVHPGRYPRRRESHFFQGIFEGLLLNRRTGQWSGTDDEFFCLARQRFAEALYDVPALMAGMVNGRNPVITFDKTPAYIHLKKCPEFVTKTCPWGVKILIMLRNPVDRAFSQFKMDDAKYPEKFGSFEDRLRQEVTKMRLIDLNQMPLLPMNATMEDVDELDFPVPNGTHEINFAKFEQLKRHTLLKKGLYAIQICEWLKEIPRTDVLFQYYEDLKQHPETAYFRVQQFLGLETHYLQKYAHIQAGNYTPMNMVTRRYLERFFEPYNRQLEEVLGEPMHPSWT